MIKDYKDFTKELASCCAAIDEYIDPHAMGDFVEYWLRKPVDLKKLDKLVEMTLFIEPCGRYEKKDHWVLEVMDYPVNRDGKVFHVVKTYPGRWRYDTDED